MDLNELQSLQIRELAELAQKLNIKGGVSGLNKQELTVRILEAQAKKDDALSARGVLEVMQDGYGFYVHLILIIYQVRMIYMLVHPR